MATPGTPQLTVTEAYSDYGSDIDDLRGPDGSEYGSDFDPEEETLIGDLLARIAATAPTEKAIESTVVYASIEGGNAFVRETVLHASPPSAVVRLADPCVNVELFSRHLRSPSVEAEYDSHSRQSWDVSRQPSEDKSRVSPSSDARRDDDMRSPLERFRTKPKKPLSVTDLVSPAWCELQYWYNLTRFGRKPQTEAMRQGSRVHRVLEEEVHDIVPVQVKSKEDGFGLRIWNSVQGLRTLRATGLTRELDIWGIIDGEVVNGVIDEVSYTCPDPAFEETLMQSRKRGTSDGLLPGQLTLSESLKKASQSESAWPGSLESDRAVYIADVKTRGHKSVPAGASLRPTWMQLMLYRKILESLSSNTVDAGIVFARYGVKPLEPFTEVFLDELGALDPQGGVSVDGENSSGLLQAPGIRNHNNVSALWSLMISEYQQSATLFSDVLRAEFRYVKTGEVIGSEVFAYNANTLEDYTADEMSWWKGQRDAKGVEIEEAFKCRTCNFADECTWRKSKIEEATEKYRLRSAARTKSAV